MAAHRRLQTEFGVDHPNLWQFIEGLKEVQYRREMLLARFRSGGEPPAERKRYTSIDKKLPELVTDFHTHELSRRRVFLP